MIAANAFASSLRDLLSGSEPITEAGLRDRWLAEMRRESTIYPHGWYDPPPDGIGVLVGTEDDCDRLNYPSLRHQKYWPSHDVVFDRRKGITYVYASPVDTATGMIGDWGMRHYILATISGFKTI